jgi:hypothetical protein
VWKNFNTRIAVLHLVPGFDVKVRLRSTITMLGSEEIISFDASG